MPRVQVSPSLPGAACARSAGTTRACVIRACTFASRVCYSRVYNSAARASREPRTLSLLDASVEVVEPRADSRSAPCCLHSRCDALSAAPRLDLCIHHAYAPPHPSAHTDCLVDRAQLSEHAPARAADGAHDFGEAERARLVAHPLVAQLACARTTARAFERESVRAVDAEAGAKQRRAKEERTEEQPSDAANGLQARSQHRLHWRGMIRSSAN
eukprot:4754715-Pleurochrysis_carterae.AAC.2